MGTAQCELLIALLENGTDSSSWRIVHGVEIWASTLSCAVSRTTGFYWVFEIRQSSVEPCHLLDIALIRPRRIKETKLRQGWLCLLHGILSFYSIVRGRDLRWKRLFYSLSLIIIITNNASPHHFTRVALSTLCLQPHRATGTPETSTNRTAVGKSYAESLLSTMTWSVK